MIEENKDSDIITKNRILKIRWEIGEGDVQEIERLSMFKDI